MCPLPWGQQRTETLLSDGWVFSCAGEVPTLTALFPDPTEPAEPPKGPYVLQSNLHRSTKLPGTERTRTKLQTNFWILSLPWAAHPSPHPLRSLSHLPSSRSTKLTHKKSQDKGITICLPLQSGDTSLDP